jgi:hypothetical protein
MRDLAPKLRPLPRFCIPCRKPAFLLFLALVKLAGPLPLWRICELLPTTMMQTDDGGKRKWCPLCYEWKAATVMVSQLKDSELVESSHELTYCPKCGAMLRDEPNKKPRTGG